eukprot:IDg15108t1
MHALNPEKTNKCLCASRGRQDENSEVFCSKADRTAQKFAINTSALQAPRTVAPAPRIKTIPVPRRSQEHSIEESKQLICRFSKE